jgi:3-mercaptopyruvate sulfurtransferase SseA
MSVIPVHQRGYANPQLLAETNWLADHLDDPTDREVNTYCGGGRRGSIGTLVLKLLGYDNARSYAAGFSQWSRQPDTPVER